MKRAIFYIICLIVLYKSWDHFTSSSVQPKLYDENYVAVYGRDSCGYTQRMLKDLKRSGVNYYYLSIEDEYIANTLHSRMRNAGIDTRRYLLPVVDINGNLSVRPDSGDIINKYMSSY